jgi:hypothetical protein
MCNLYSLTKGQGAIIAIARAMRDITGNLPPLPGIFPDYMAPVVRNAPDGVRELAMLRWGMPGPPQFRGALSTNIRNTPHWRGWLKPANRCVVPFTSFCEYADTKPKNTPTWFAFRRQPAACLLRWDLDAVERHPRQQSQVGRRRASTLRVLDNGRERRGRRDPSEGDAGHFGDTGRDRALDDRAR